MKEYRSCELETGTATQGNALLQLDYVDDVPIDDVVRLRVLVKCQIKIIKKDECSHGVLMKFICKIFLGTNIIFQDESNDSN